MTMRFWFVDTRTVIQSGRYAFYAPRKKREIGWYITSVTSGGVRIDRAKMSNTRRPSSQENVDEAFITGPIKGV